MAISKERKDELISQYRDWANRSQAMFLTEYSGLTMKDIDSIRSKAREVGGEFHIIKNTLGKLAFEAEGLTFPEEFSNSSTAIVFAFSDALALAKVLMDIARSSEFLKVKGGYMERQLISARNVQDLADLPPLPVVRARLLGTLMAPASQLVTVFAAPIRQIATVIKAFAEKENVPASA